LKVVGIVLSPGELDGNGASLEATPAFAQAYRDRAVACDVGVYQLRRGLDDITTFQSGVLKTDPEGLELRHVRRGGIRGALDPEGFRIPDSRVAEPPVACALLDGKEIHAVLARLLPRWPRPRNRAALT